MRVCKVCGKPLEYLDGSAYEALYAGSWGQWWCPQEKDAEHQAAYRSEYHTDTVKNVARITT